MGGRTQLFVVMSNASLSTVRLLTVLFVMCAMTGCGVLNVGKWKGLERTDSDEQYYLLKNCRLVSSSSARAKKYFDHALDDAVSLIFTPANEKNRYVTKSIWYDPKGQEYRTIRQTHDKTDENSEQLNRPKGGSTRIHSLPLMPMFNHGKGQWKVELFLDGELARRLDFHVR